MSVQLADLVARTPELAAMPASSARLLTLLEEPDTPVSDVLAVIEKDPGLTANLLKLCNSAYYGVRREVGSVREALVRLGNQTVITLAFAASMGRLLQVPVTAYRLPRGQLWRHTLAVGLLATRWLPAGPADVERHRAFTAGVVHDIGKLLLDRPLRDGLEQLPSSLDYEGLLAAERQLLGFDHAQAGAALAESWNFPVDLVAVIAEHHGAGNENRLAALITAADLLASQRGHDGGAPVVDDAALEDALTSAGLDPDQTLADADPALRDLDGMLALLGA
ncbi:MAG: HDOD domain-containing protein [Candidatus Krumholzibacteria bacterium]|jgi:putative nucleotidyltransferase with HDIG domain|nr:HDOD domain-containing protein [Candidatus Krumholzibacteria bacterium]